MLSMTVLAGWNHQECLHRAQLTLAGAGALSSLLVALWGGIVMFEV